MVPAVTADVASEAAIDEATSRVDAELAAASNDAAAAGDEAGKEEERPTTTSSGEGDEGDAPKSMRGMMKELKKHSEGTNVIKESIRTWKMEQGSDAAEKGDVIVGDAEEALARIKELMDSDRSALSRSGKKKDKKKAARWDFRSSPHEQFGKTLDDTFRAFAVWARAKDGKGKGGGGYNVSKAFRRLVSYADWMDDTGDDLTEPALTADSCRTALDAWAMKCSVSSDGTFCWWIDLGVIDVRAIKKDIPPRESLRAFVWYSHYVMYDDNAQRNGIIFVENCAKVGFIEGMTMVPMKLGLKLDRLTIGVLPIRMNKFYILETPTWMDMMMKFMSAFMSKKMQSRIVIVTDGDKGAIEGAVGGKDKIPKGFGKLDGSHERDPVEVQYFSS